MTTEPMEAVKLMPCPFCGEHLSAEEDYYTHPENNCFLSRWEFDRPDPAQWNRRAQVEAPTSEPVARRGDWLSVARKHGYALPDARMQDFVAELLAAPQVLPATEQAKPKPFTTAQLELIEQEVQRRTTECVKILNRADPQMNAFFDEMLDIPVEQAKPYPARLADKDRANIALAAVHLKESGFHTASDNLRALLATPPVAQAKPDDALIQIEGGPPIPVWYAKAIYQGWRSRAGIDQTFEQFVEKYPSFLTWESMGSLYCDKRTSNACNPKSIIDFALASQAKPDASERDAGIERAAKWIAKRREDFEIEHGVPDWSTGTISYGTGQHAEAKLEYTGELVEIEDGIRALKSVAATTSKPNAEGGA